MVSIGTILDLSEDGAIVMTKKCNFIKIRKQSGMEPGQEVTFDIADVLYPVAVKGKSPSVLKPAALVVSSIAAIFILVFLSMQFLVVKSEFAYIDVDINPSLSFAIDGKMLVLEVKPVNEDAKLVIKDLEYKNKLLSDVLNEVIDNAKMCGFIKTDNSANVILISASLNDKNRKYKDNRAKEERKLETCLNSLNETVNKLKDISISAKIIRVNPETRSLALRNNVSMGRYFIYENANRQGMAISLDEIKDGNMKDLLDKLQEPLPEAEPDQDTTKPSEITGATPVPVSDAATETYTKAQMQTVNPANTPDSAYTSTSANTYSPAYTSYSSYIPYVEYTPDPAVTLHVEQTPYISYRGEPTDTPVVTNVPSTEPSPTASGSSGFNGYYRIVNLYSKKLAVVENSLSTNNAKILQGTDKGNHNADWELMDLGNGYYKIVNRLSSKAVTVERGLLSESAKLVQKDYTDSEIEQWQLVDLGNGCYKIVNRLSGKCWDDDWFSVNDGTSIVQKEFINGDNQKWQIVKVVD